MGYLMRRLLAVTGLIMGAQLLLPPYFVDESSAQAASLEDIHDRGYLIVAVKDNRVPMGFIDGAGNLAGFEIDIARQLAQALLGDAEAVQLVPVSNVERLSAVMEERVDVAIASLTLTEPRRRLVNFSDPYYLDGTAFAMYAGANETVARAEELRDLRLGTIALLNRSSAVAHVRYILPTARLVSVTSYAEGQALLESGRVDAFAGDASILAGWVRTREGLSAESSLGYRLLPEIISAEPLAIALPKGQQYDTLRAAVNQTVRDWYAQEWLQENAEFWGLPSGILPSLSSVTDE
ncbi:MAG: transporter substrate-binding domain-containing protein [Cyanobacteria bacterium J06632_3]